MIPHSNFNNILYGLNLRLDNIHFVERIYTKKHKRLHSFLNMLPSFIGAVEQCLSGLTEPWEQHPCGCGKAFQEAEYALNQPPIHGAVSQPGVRGPTLKEWKWEGLHQYYLCYSTSKMFVSFPINLRLSGSQEILVSKRGRLPQGDTTVIPLNWKLTLPPRHFGLLMSLN